ncbi:MAG: nicotinamide-nucleotide adenylyltransferase [Promethearchaeota archaeon]
MEKKRKKPENDDSVIDSIHTTIKSDKSDESSNQEEILCGFDPKNIKYFHTGKLSPYIFPIRYNEAHKKKIPHLIVRIFAKSLDGMYLIQKRSHKKKMHRGRWTDSASGHVRFREGFSYEHIEEDAYREFKEEMGADLLAIRFIGFNLKEFAKVEEYLDYEISYNFIAICNKNIKINLEEVSEESGFITEEKLKKLLKIPRTDFQKPWVEEARVIWKNIIRGKYDYLFKDMIKEIEENKDIISRKSDIVINQKKYDKGLIIGRFQPFHKGHLLLIKECLKYVKLLKIGIGSSQIFGTVNNPFTFEERRKFIIESLKMENIPKKRFKIYKIPDKFNFQKWIDSLIHISGDFDVIFTNNLWIGRIFQLKGKKFIGNLKFNFEEYNGSKIREFIYKRNNAWKSLVPEPVKQYISKSDVMNRLERITQFHSK